MSTTECFKASSSWNRRSFTLDYKRGFDAVLETIAAMANSYGGDEFQSPMVAIPHRRACDCGPNRLHEEYPTLLRDLYVMAESF